jgi:predicted AAA+ superfamily ATPase
MVRIVSDTLRNLLLVHNPWLAEPARQAEMLRARLPTPFLPRTARPEPSEERAIVVVGPRRAGKSTLLLDVAHRQPLPVVVVNAEEPAVRALCSSPAGFVRWLRDEVLEGPALLIFEEVQHLAEAALFLKGLVDLRTGHRVAATGSSSFHLRSRTRESLAGRADRITLLPLSLAEAVAGASGPRIARESRAAGAWQRQLAYGGYPSVWLAQKPELELARLVEAFVLRDASDLHRVADLDSFRTILRLAATDQGSLVNVSTWASEAGVARDTVGRYLEILEQSHVVRRVGAFLGGKRAEIKASVKVFFLDCGVRNALLGTFAAADRRADAGALAEGWALGEIAKTIGLLDTVRYWRTRNGAEVDFVVSRGGRSLAIEVKHGALREPRLSRAAREFAALYRPGRLLVVNRELRHETEVEGVPVSFCRPWDLARLLGA